MDLIERFVEEKRPEYATSWHSPLYEELRSRGTSIVPSLIIALTNNSAAYVEKRLDFIYVLGEIGDARAYAPLVDLFEKSKDEARWRIGISIASCLTPENVDEFVRLVTQDKKTFETQILRDITGENLGYNFNAWLHHLKNHNNLHEANKKARKLSMPLH